MYNRNRSNTVFGVLLVFLVLGLLVAAFLAGRVTAAPQPAPTQAPEEEVVAPSAVDVLYVNEAVADTADTASLIAVLDRDFPGFYDQGSGNQWSEPGFTVPAGSVFYTDFLNAGIPQGVTVIRNQGNWGVYYTPNDLLIPAENGGGRYIRVSAPPTVPLVSVSAP